ncbi:hypothetical protein NOCA2200002 [metagenome]|uniref:Uncharacterized protein n=1 Tax=metagenome TaxID=256318 RepID=A0A2P2C1L0_9ZZZZ
MTEVHGSTDGDYEVAEYCGRLSCGKVIVQTAGRGRRREFCSETCRRGADREYKRAKGLVEHFERYLRKTRHEVAAYGRKAEVDGGFQTPDELAAVRLAAAAAVSRAQGILDFAGGEEDRFLDELRRLTVAVGPLVGTDSEGVRAEVS